MVSPGASPSVPRSLQSAADVVLAASFLLIGLRLICDLETDVDADPMFLLLFPSASHVSELHRPVSINSVKVLFVHPRFACASPAHDPTVVCAITGVTKPSWTTVLDLMSQSGFLVVLFSNMIVSSVFSHGCHCVFLFLPVSFYLLFIIHLSARVSGI